MYEFQNSKNLINLNNLIYKYKTEGRRPKDFSNYQNPIDIFINLRDGNINQKQVLKNHIRVKSDLGEKEKEIENQIQKIK